MAIFACVRALRSLKIHGLRALALSSLRSIPIVTLLALVQSGWAQPQLSLTEAQRIAVERSRQLAAQDASISASREMATAAGQLPDPVLKFGIDNLPVDGPDRFSLGRDFMTMGRIGLMQEFTRDDKRRLKSERFHREADVAIAEKAATVATLQRDTALAWLETYYLERMRAIVAAQSEETQLEIEAAEGAFRSGRGPQADIYIARASRVALEDRRSELERRIRNARAMLARWVGDAAERTLIGEPATATLSLVSHKLDQELERHPEITVLRQQIAVAETEARIAQANKRPDISLELAYQQRGSAFSNMVSFGVSIPLQWDQKNRQDREVAAKLALADRARAQQEEMLRAHIAEVRTLLNDWENGQERLARYRRELVPLAKDRTEAALSGYRAAKGDLSSVLAARRNELDVQTQSLQLEMEIGRVWAQLNFLGPDGAHGVHTEAGATSGRAK